MTDSIFTKVINRELPSTIYYEDDEFIVIKDIHPAAPVHALVIPKHPWQTLEEVAESDEHFHARLLLVARTVAKQLGIADNYKLSLNVGHQVQLIPHIHLHVMGGWPKTKTAQEISDSSHV